MTDASSAGLSPTGIYSERTSGPPTTNTRIVLLHGFGATGFTWRHGLTDLAARGEVLNADLKGFGRSAKPDDGRYAVRDLSDGIVEWVDAEVDDPIVLIGHSLGGSVALLAALDLQRRGRAPLGVVLVSTPAFPQRLPPFVRFAKRPRWSRFLLRIVGARRVVRYAIRTCVYDAISVDDEAVEAYSEAWATGPGVRAALEVARELIPPDVEALIATYPELTVPALVLHGTEDRVVPPRSGERLAAALPVARLEWIERCGHLPQEERPTESYTAIGSFLDEIGAVSSASP